MTTYLASRPAMPSACDETADNGSIIGDAAVVWATLNILEQAPHRDQAALARAARTRLLRDLERQGLHQQDLYEHLMDAVERRDWGSLGLAEPER